MHYIEYKKEWNGGGNKERKKKEKKMMEQTSFFVVRDVLDKLKVTQAWLLAMKVTIKLPKTSE